MKEQSTKDKSIALYKIADIKDVEYFYLAPIFLGLGDILKNLDKLSFKIGIDQDIDVKEKLYKTIIGIEFASTNDNNEVLIFCRYRVLFSYIIENFDEIINHNYSDGNKFTISDNVVLSLFGLSMSTLRGMLISKTANSEINGIIIPPINTQRLKNAIDEIKVKN